MALSLLKFFKRKGGKEQAAPAPAATPVVEKPSGERLSKTVMPNATRTAPAGDPFHAPAHPMPMPASVPAARPAISLNPTPPPAAPPTPAPSAIPPAVALALEPKVERALPFALADVVAQMPAGFVRPLSDVEANRRILLKAAELERGMANGRPSVSIATLYQQVPEIFTRPVAPSDAEQVVLPFAKVLEQFTRLQQRTDQYREQAVPQVETPFLKVTLEDDTKFGTSTVPLMGDSLPPVRVMPATAETIAAAEPEPMERVPFAIPAPPTARNAQSDGSANGNAEATVAEPFQESAPAAPAPTAAPTRIPFKLTPNGTGVPAAERVPASSGGASVPTSLQSPMSPVPATAANPVRTPDAPTPVRTPEATPAPTRIPFKLGAATENAAAKGEPWLTKENFETSDAPAAPMKLAPAPQAKAPAVTISLPLKPILHALPPFQLTGDINAVSNDARIELPFSLVEPQLASGRVHLTPEDFAAALPEEHRGLFSAKEIATPVLLPLQDVLKNLPGAALRMRDDQEEQERGSNFATPFSATAEEDAKRFNVASAPVAKPTISLTTPPEKSEPEPKITDANPTAPGARPSVVASVAQNDALAEQRAPEQRAEQRAPEPVAPKPAALKPAPVKLRLPKTRTALQEALDTDDELDAKAVVAHVEKLKGVKGCAIMFGDGLNLAGQLPESYEADGLCAMAPSMLQRVENHMVETRLGTLRAMTLACTDASISFFMHDNLCLAVLHAADLTTDVRTRLGRTIQELSVTYSQPV